MNDNGYGSNGYEMFPKKKPYKLTDFEIDDLTMLQYLSDEDKVEWLKTLQRTKDLEKKGRELDRLREPEEASDDEE